MKTQFDNKKNKNYLTYTTKGILIYITKKQKYDS